MNNHMYKIGQKVAIRASGQKFYIVGIKTSSYEMTGLREARLIVGENKNTPSRNGYTVWPCHCDILEVVHE